MRSICLSLILLAIVSFPCDIASQNPDDTLNTILYLDYKPFPGQFWLGETIRFEPEETSYGTFLRQIGNPQAGSHVVYANSSVYYGSWEFSVMFDGFTTSNQNRIWVWLMADDTEYPEGYAVRIGESGTMKYARLVRLRGLNQADELLRSNRVLPDDNRPFNVKVERSVDGLWRMGVKTAIDTQYQWSEASDDEAPFFAPFFGFQTNFTATRADRFLFGPVNIDRHSTSIRSVRVLTPSVIALEFTDIIPNASTNFPNLRVVSENGIAASIRYVSADDFSLIVEFNSPLPGGEYTVETGEFDDIRTGNRMQSQHFQFTLFDVPAFGDLIINELLPRAHDGVTPQFVELYNVSNKFLNLENWRLRRGSQSVTLPSKHIMPGDYLVISRTAFSQLAESPSATLVVPLPVFSVSQDQLWLQDSKGVLIDSVSYSSSLTSSLTPGQSLERIDPSYPGSHIVNWRQHPSGYHTAGTENMAANLDLPQLRLENARLIDTDTILVDFNLIAERSAQTKFNINETTLNEVMWSLENGTQLYLTNISDTDWIEKSRGILQIQDIQRFGSTQNESFQIEVAQQVNSKGDLLINEILYQPIQNRYSSFSDQSEYIEILNTRPFSLDLSSVFITDTPDKHEQYRSWIPENRHLWRVEAQNYAVIHADTASEWSKTRIAAFFQLDNASNFARVNRSTLGLTSSGRGIYLRTPEAVVDSVYYSPAWHHPFVSDPRGRSLERVSSRNLDQLTWSTSAAHLGGTPGVQNSITINTDHNTIAQQAPGLYVTPNPFSPDMDGFDDMTDISVLTPGFGYTTSIRIFNRYGRNVRNLMRDSYTGNEQRIVWNGTDNAGRLLPTGIYIVYAELNHPEKPSERYTEALVLVRRK